MILSIVFHTHRYFFKIGQVDKVGENCHVFWRKRPNLPFFDPGIFQGSHLVFFF